MLFTPESFTFFMSELQKLDRLFQTPHAASYAARDTAHPKSHRSDDQQKPNRHCSVQRILDAHYSKIDEELRAALANGEPILQQMLDIHSQQAEIGIASKINSVQNQNDSLSDTYESLRQQLQDNADSFKKRIDAFPAELKQQLDDERKQQEDMITEECLIHQQDFRNAFSAKKEAPRTVHHSQLTAEEQAFLRAFPPNNYMAEYVRIYNLEPEYAAYSCCKAIPENFHICTMEYPLKDLGLSTRAVEFLQLHYPYMIRGNMLCMPYSIPFDKSFNHFFRFHKSNRGQAEKDASAQGMRLLTMIPPGKVRLTLIDPVKLGSTFVILNQVVSPADGARELITEKVWCSASDIEKQLNEVSILSQTFSRVVSAESIKIFATITGEQRKMPKPTVCSF